MTPWAREWIVVGGFIAKSQALNLDINRLLTAAPGDVFLLDSTDVRDCVISLPSDGDFSYVAGMISEET